DIDRVALHENTGPVFDGPRNIDLQHGESSPIRTSEVAIPAREAFVQIQPKKTGSKTLRPGHLSCKGIPPSQEHLPIRAGRDARETREENFRKCARLDGFFHACV